MPLLLLLWLPAVGRGKAAAATDFDALMRKHGLVDVATLDPSITVDLKYSTSDNFVGRDMYGGLKKAYLYKATAQSLLKALKQLQAIDPKWSFIVYDAARPVSVQRIMWDIVKGTDKQKYVASPHRGGPHNYGIAVDIALTYDGRPVDMGTPFDSFTSDAHITDEPALVRQGRISATAMKNRQLLRKVLTDNGFATYSREWWHFTRYNMTYVRKHIRLLDF
ncbi:MAG: M15 family metallopeptidase [Muribaculaceae bacterium]|nr:M15 family metallopeptidase [Muribaculaceae bacterium]